MDKSTDMLRDHVCDKGGGVKKSEIFMDVIDGSPLIADADLCLYMYSPRLNGEYYKTRDPASWLPLAAGLVHAT